MKPLRIRVGTNFRDCGLELNGFCLQLSRLVLIQHRRREVILGSGIGHQFCFQGRGQNRTTACETEQPQQWQHGQYTEYGWVEPHRSTSLLGCSKQPVDVLVPIAIHKGWTDSSQEDLRELRKKYLRNGLWKAVMVS